MTIDPFDEELEVDTLVPADPEPTIGAPKPVETMEDFVQRLTKLSPRDLACLLATMKSPKAAGDPHSPTLD